MTSSRPLLKDILRATCEIMLVTRNQIYSLSRDRKTLLARALCAHVARQQGYSFLQIGELVHRDHSTVIWMVDRFGQDDRRRDDLAGEILERARVLRARGVAQMNSLLTGVPLPARVPVRLVPAAPVKETAPLKPYTERQFSDDWWQRNDANFREGMRRAYPEMQKGRSLA